MARHYFDREENTPNKMAYFMSGVNTYVKEVLYYSKSYYKFTLHQLNKQ